MSTDQSLANTLRRGYEHALKQPFLTAPDGTGMTYAELEARATRFGGALRSHHVDKGDRVLVKTAKSGDGVALYLACLRMGAVYVPLNPALTPSEQEYFFHDAEPSLVINEPGDEPHRDLPTLTLGTEGTGTLVDAAEAAEPLEDIAAIGAEDVAVMIYTSGTTGRPKGAMLTNGNLVANGRALHKIWGFGPNDVLLHPLPIFHAHGLFVALHCSMLSGCEIRFLPRFTVDAVLGELAASTVMMAVPTIYNRLMADTRFGPSSCETIRLFTSGSAPMTAILHRAFTERTGHHILERYGMSEAGMITSNPLNGERVPGTVGFALPGCELRIVADGRRCAPGEPGVVEIRGPHVFAGYWKMEAETAREFRDDGFFITGDIGSLDTEARLTLQGRAGDMIISGGENIYPREIELCLDQSPGVVESAVVGVQDADLGEVVVAYLVVDASYNPETVRRAVEHDLASFKRPRRYEVLAELPRNSMGKVQKNVLRSR